MCLVSSRKPMISTASLTFTTSLCLSTISFHWQLSSVLCISIIGVSFYNITIGTLGFLNTFLVIDIITILISVIGAVSFNLYIQILYRLVLGLMVGLNTVVIPTYLTSCLPGSMGGPAGSLNQFFITLGIFLGYVFGLFFYDSQLGDIGWRLLVAFPLFPSLVRIYTSKYVYPYESV